MSQKLSTRDKYLLSKYGMYEADYNRLRAEANYTCCVCGKTEEEKGSLMVVDHDHKTREVRGVICRACNHRVVGSHRDPDLLSNAADYLRREGTGFFAPLKKRKRRIRRRK